MDDRLAWLPGETLDLARVSERVSFLYIERARVSREDGAISVWTKPGRMDVPASLVATLLLGPGTTVTHQAMVLLADSGTTVCWTAQGGTRMHAVGQGLSRTSRYLSLQASSVSNPRARLAVARRMYDLRFPGEDLSGLSLNQLRSREGARMKAVYRTQADRTGVRWDGRSYRAGDLSASDPINVALSSVNAALYAVSHAVIASLGLSPGLGFIHSGGGMAFVHDVADLYKVELAIPLAFDVVHSSPGAAEKAARTEFRRREHHARLLPRIVTDVCELLDPGSEPPVDLTGDVIGLWDGKVGVVRSGRNYADKVTP